MSKRCFAREDLSAVCSGMYLWKSGAVSYLVYVCICYVYTHVDTRTPCKCVCEIVPSKVYRWIVFTFVVFAFPDGCVVYSHVLQAVAPHIT